LKIYGINYIKHFIEEVEENEKKSIGTNSSSNGNRNASGFSSSWNGIYHCFSFNTYFNGLPLYPKILTEVKELKIMVIRMPKFLGSIIKRICGIKSN